MRGRRVLLRGGSLMLLLPLLREDGWEKLQHNDAG